jgi:phospholipase/lecithinase/hemolysin
MMHSALRKYTSRSFATLLLLSAPAFAGHDCDRFVVFGDSLSDPGNRFFVDKKVSEPPFSVVPEEPYDVNGHRFTDGPTWIEQLAKQRHTPASAAPALIKPGVNTNYAFGGARSRANAPGSEYDLAVQVNLFMNDFHGHASAKSMYVIWIGANDVGDAVAAAASDPSGAASSQIVQAAVGAVGDNIEALWTAGARSFLIVNVPDLGLTPALLLQGSTAAAAGTQLSAAYNSGLLQVISQLQVLPGIHLATLSSFDLIRAVVKDPREFGIVDAQNPCLAFSVVANAFCSHPDEHLFWDGLHPTFAGHGIVERAAEKVLAPAMTQHAVY